MGGNRVSQSLGVVILNYNSYEDSERCVIEFLKQVEAGDRILVLDNNSNDGSGERLAERFAGESNIIFRQNEENLGYARGNNVGIVYFREQKFDLTLICNPDIILTPGALQILRKTLINKSACSVGPKILNPDGSVAIDCAKNRLGIREKFFVTTPLRSLDFFGIGKRFYYGYDYSKLMEVYMLSGSFMMFTTEILSKVGGFDESTFLYEEEPIIFHKIHKEEESTVLFCPDAVVIHDHPRGLKSQATIRHFVDSEQYYLKHYLGANSLIRFFFRTIRNMKKTR